ncbi:MAG: hypothetical protein NXI18_13510 [Alphaproteobacteria bacterium]|nr:hypothetical protein [Alphaproteobacteria bacterium]
MTREEIESTLLRGGAVPVGDSSGGEILLAEPNARRAASVLFEQLRGASADELRNDDDFFEALETAFLAEDDKDTKSPASPEDPSGLVRGPTSQPSKVWRLKLIETQGFGGLNAVSGDTFRFEVAGRDFCIEGQNGSGKSSLTNAVLFAMTGQIHRDQFGLVDAKRCEPVAADNGKTIAEWPPIAIYPEDWGIDRPDVDVQVTLTFTCGDDDCTAIRRLHGAPDNLADDHNIAPELTGVRTLIDAGLLMPMRVQHIRMANPNDNQSLLALIRQLIGLDPLIHVAELATSLGHGGQRFRKYAKDKDIGGRVERINKLLEGANEVLSEQDPDLGIEMEVDGTTPVAEEDLRLLQEAAERVEKLQADGFEDLRKLAFDEFDPANTEHQARVSQAVADLATGVEDLRKPANAPAILRDLRVLSSNVSDGHIDRLLTALSKARQDLEDAEIWAEKQETDARLRLKAIAAPHFQDCEDPLCPLCEQPLKIPQHTTLLTDLKVLTKDAEAAQTRLEDACRRILDDIVRARDEAVPEAFRKVQRFRAKEEFRAHVAAMLFGDNDAADTLPGLKERADGILQAVIGPLEEFEFGENVPEPENAPSRIRWIVDHLDDVCSAAQNWTDETRQPYRDAWSGLFAEAEENTAPLSLTTEIGALQRTIASIVPYRTAGKKLEDVIKEIAEYNAIVKRQILRDAIAKSLSPLRELMMLVNRTTQQTINDVSGLVEQVHAEIYNSEALLYDKTDVKETRNKQSLSFRGRLGKDQDWTIDAAVLANTSWMRGILWSFVFAIRQRAIESAGGCPFPLVMLDDPQITFDTRNQKGWVKWLGLSDGLRKDHPVHIVITTHGHEFAQEMQASKGVTMGAIETARRPGAPAQLVLADFAEIRFQQMEELNSDPKARELISAIRVLAETLLRFALSAIDPKRVERKDANIGRLVEEIAQSRQNGEAPFTDGVFERLIKLKDGNTIRFSELSEPHHKLTETITVREGRQAYKFWKTSLFPALHAIWESYRFLQKTVFIDGGTVRLPANTNHQPIRSNDLASVRPVIVGRVSAYSDGRLASALQLVPSSDTEVIDLQSRAVYRLEKDTLSPVAQVGDFLLTRLDQKTTHRNLVIEDRGDHLIARRLLEDDGNKGFAVMSAASSNPKETQKAVVSRMEGARRFKIAGILFASQTLAAGALVDGQTEATALDATDPAVQTLVAGTEVFEVQGSSAEPLALNGQFLLAKPPSRDLSRSIADLDGKPVIAETTDGDAYFKRLRKIADNMVALESLDKTGLESLIVLELEEVVGRPGLRQLREVVGVVFDRA